MLVLALLFGAISPAAAKPSKKLPTDPDQVVAWYTVEEIRPDGSTVLVYEGSSLDGYVAEPEVGIMAEIPGSKTVTYKVTTYGFLGQTLYRMYNKLSWKWDSSYRCTMVSRSGWGEAVAQGWYYLGLNHQAWWGNGTNYITSQYQGSFRNINNGVIMYSGVQVRGWTGGYSECTTYK